MYCRNCAVELHPQAIACPKCGVPPLLEKKFCNNCGTETNVNQVICVKCGIQLPNLATVNLETINLGNRSLDFETRNLENVPSHKGEAIIKMMKNRYLFSAIVNGVIGLTVGIIEIICALFTFGLTLIFLLIPMINILCMVLELVSYFKLKEKPSQGDLNFFYTVSFVEIILGWGLLLPLVVGILNLISLSDKSFKDYVVQQ